MPKLFINNLMKYDLLQYPYHVIDIVDEHNWFILHSAYAIEEAQEYLSLIHGEDGDFYIVDYRGKEV